MNPLMETKERRTSVDAVFDYLYDQISSLQLLPGDKISEAEIASQFGISRQPVRDAFSRLDNLGLLLIRPQRATEVKRFSSREIEKSRFVRAAVEAEVIRRATRHCDSEAEKRFNTALEDQRKTVDLGDYDLFARLDYAFHKLLCDVAKAPYAFEVISAEKAKVDRLCMLSLSKEDRMPLLLRDHEQIVENILAGNEDKAVDIGMVHLSRLDETISAISKSNAEYFDS